MICAAISVALIRCAAKEDHHRRRDRTESQMSPNCHADAQGAIESGPEHDLYCQAPLRRGFFVAMSNVGSR